MALSAMMQQYLTIKEQNKDCILFFRLGDFYEMFFDDAIQVSKELELTLTGRDCGLSERAPMCGVPHHAADTYVARLIEKGYKVAICEQMTDPALSKGLVERAVTRIVTPGTVIENNMLEDKKPNYILSVLIHKDKAGIAFSDVSTGEFCLYEFSHVRLRLFEEISRIAPSEIITYDRQELSAYYSNPNFAVSEVEEDTFEYSHAREILKFHFGETAIKNDHSGKLALAAAGALIEYLSNTQKNALKHILYLTPYDSTRYMSLDRCASANLELTQTVRGQSRKGSLLSVLDKTVTAMGGRMLRSWIERPLIVKREIELRLGAVETLVNDPMLLDELREKMSYVYDVERLLSKIAYESVNPHDCLALAKSLNAVPAIRELLSGRQDLLGDLFDALDPLTEIADEMTRAISEDAPLTIKEGGIFNNGYLSELDELRSASRDGKKWLSDLEATEREATGIKNLKIGYNRVFGYYIEVTKSFYDMVPYRYIRKQTLANCERFITDELKTLETTILGADENAIRMEYDMFVTLRETLKSVIHRLSQTANALKTLDALCSLAKTAVLNGYVRPEINVEGVYDIKEGRHPVVEDSIGREK
ncbi:MAG: DNA mismatch repair protein MutS, partial [Clostridia bacterium]|nr:DNA mismatch repair protein MutS [Clostridia bacterium]